jgi:hypothetical protein
MTALKCVICQNEVTDAIYKKHLREHGIDELVEYIYQEATDMDRNSHSGLNKAFSYFLLKLQQQLVSSRNGIVCKCRASTGAIHGATVHTVIKFRFTFLKRFYRIFL